MNRENENLPENHSKISAVEAALAQLRPRREARFADDVKNQLKDALSDQTPTSENVTATIKIPLKQYIRFAQFNAAAGGLLLGLLFGVLLGGSIVYYALSRFPTERVQPVQAPFAVRSPYRQMLLENESTLTPMERSFLRELAEEPSHGRK